MDNSEDILDKFYRSYLPADCKKADIFVSWKDGKEVQIGDMTWDYEEGGLVIEYKEGHRWKSIPVSGTFTEILEEALSFGLGYTKLG